MSGMLRTAAPTPPAVNFTPWPRVCQTVTDGRVEEVSECVSALVLAANHHLCQCLHVPTDVCLLVCVRVCVFKRVVRYLVCHRLSAVAMSERMCVILQVCVNQACKWVRSSVPPAASIKQRHHLFWSHGWGEREEVSVRVCVCVCWLSKGAKGELRRSETRGRMIKDVWGRQFSRQCVDGSISLWQESYEPERGRYRASSPVSYHHKRNNHLSKQTLIIHKRRGSDFCFSKDAVPV